MNSLKRWYWAHERQTDYTINVVLVVLVALGGIATLVSQNKYLIGCTILIVAADMIFNLVVGERSRRREEPKEISIDQRAWIMASPYQNRKDIYYEIRAEEHEKGPYAEGVAKFPTNELSRPNFEIETLPSGDIRIYYPNDFQRMVGGPHPRFSVVVTG